MSALEVIGAVTVGSAAGGAARYWVVDRFGRWLGQRMPWGTIAVNLTGALLIGGMAVGLPHGSPAAAFLMVGFCGSLTTFSSVALQMLQQLDSGRRGAAVMNVIVSLVAAVPMAAAGCYAASVWG